MSLEIKRPSGLTVSPSIVQLNGEVIMSCIVTSTVVQTVTITFSILDAGVVFPQGTSYAYEQEMHIGDNNVNDTNTLMNNGLSESQLIDIRVTVIGDDQDADTDSITVVP